MGSAGIFAGTFRASPLSTSLAAIMVSSRRVADRTARLRAAETSQDSRMYRSTLTRRSPRLRTRTPWRSHTRVTLGGVHLRGYAINGSPYFWRREDLPDAFYHFFFRRSARYHHLPSFLAALCRSSLCYTMPAMPIDRQVNDLRYRLSRRPRRNALLRTRAPQATLKHRVLRHNQQT